MRWGPRSAQPDWSAGHSLARSGFLFLALLRLLARGDLWTGARTLAEEAQRVLHRMRRARLRLELRSLQARVPADVRGDEHGMQMQLGRRSLGIPRNLEVTLQVTSERRSGVSIDDQRPAHRDRLFLFPQLEPARGIRIGPVLRILHRGQIARLLLPGARAEAGDGVAHDAAAFGLRLAGVPKLETSRQAIESREPRHGLLADTQWIGAVGAALVERAVQALHERLALHPDQLESLVVIVHQANREVIAGRLQQRRLLGQRDLGAAVRQPGSAEPGELHPLLCPVRSDALVDLAPRHVQDAPRQRGIVGELTRLQRFLRLRQLADGLLRGEDARARGLVLGAFAGGGAEGGDEHEAVHGSRNLNGTPSGRRRTKRAHAQSILAMVTDAVSPVKSASSPAARACR